MPTSPEMETDCRTLKQKLDAKADLLLLDCRERDEYELVRIEGSTLIPMSEMQSRVGELEPHKQAEIVVHCHHGGRSLQVTAWLRKQGYANVRSLAGGIDRWATEIDPSLPRY
jgi:rhodanese-related sulfurtransferase